MIQGGVAGHAFSLPPLNPVRERREHDIRAQRLLDRFPRNIRKAVSQGYLERRSAPLPQVTGRRVCDLAVTRAQAATDWLQAFVSRHVHLPVGLAATESDIRLFAEDSARIGCDHVRWQTCSDGLARFAQTRGVMPPKADAVEGERARLACEKWWRYHLRRSVARKTEAFAVELGQVHRRGALFCSEDAMKRHAAQRQRNGSLLESFVAINELGEEFNLQVLVDKSVSNPRNRRAELMTRVAGAEYIARQCGLAGEFITITAPSRFHAHHARDGSRNTKWAGAMPRDTQSYLLKHVWARITAALARAGIPIFGFRVAEPHHDGTPHFHGLFFLRPSHVPLFRRIVARYAVREDREELGLRYALSHDEAVDRARVLKAAGAGVGTLAEIADAIGHERAFWAHPPHSVWHQIEARVSFKAIDWERGSAAGYIAKYIAKNIDGVGHSGESIGADFESDDETASTASTAKRVGAWASTWGIRQFQQVGGPPVSVWRELRRLNAKDSNEDSVVMRAAVAADAGNWARFMEVMGGWEMRRRDMPIKLNREPAEKPNRYGEEAQPNVIGVVDCTTGQIEVTRLHEWVLKPARDARPWTRVNNSTFSKSVPAAPRASSPNTETRTTPTYEQFIAWAHEWAAPPSIVAELNDAHARAERTAEISRLIKQARDLIARIYPREVEPGPPTATRRTRRGRYAKLDTFGLQLQREIDWLKSWTEQTPIAH
ncbi:replication endonuclease [Uliginosibacterium sp. sgz301328]|uniref:replication endonuclease n=1 Tax=Uliginosibacterium sp. sgz301328 TaxID=3243764 RepID=UPI00359E601A